MSVIVKGMEMPKCCAFCELQHDGVCQMNTVESIDDIAYDGRPDWCPLVELPEKHGRLIDADELKTAFPRCDNNMDIKIASVRATINHMPTIIEAEGVDE